jgi:hypothetical protein
MSSSDSGLVIYPVPDNAPVCPDYELTVNGKPVHVYDCEVAGYAIWSSTGSVEVRARCKQHNSDTVLRPTSLGIVPVWDGNTVTFTLPAPRQVVLDAPFPHRKPLFLFASAPEIDPPDRADPNVRYFEAGKVHDAGKIVLTSGQTLYVEGGAYVRGIVEAVEADGVRVYGRGIIDGGAFRQAHTRFLYFAKCRNVEVGGITTVHTPTWTIVLHRCKGAHVHHVNQIGWYVGSDGVDVVASHDVLVEHCCFRNNDDCIAVKAFPGYRQHQVAIDDPAAPVPLTVENVEVRNCVFFNAQAGNVMEIGFELRSDLVRHVHFHDIDVIGAHGEGGVFTIHNGDHALVEDVLYENIRVEHFYDKLIDFRVLKSRYSRDEERGRIRNVTIRNVKTVPNTHNSVSLIGGYDAEHLVENITIENVVIGDTRATNGDALHLFVNEHTKNVHIS